MGTRTETRCQRPSRKRGPLYRLSLVLTVAWCGLSQAGLAPIPASHARSLGSGQEAEVIERPDLGRFFGAGLPLLPDRTFAHTDDRHPYSFFDVTHVIAPPRPAPATVAGPARPPRAAP